MKDKRDIQILNSNILKNDAVLFYAAFHLMTFAKAFGWDSSNRIYFLLFVISAAILGLRLLVMPYSTPGRCFARTQCSNFSGYPGNDIVVYVPVSGCFQRH